MARPARPRVRPPAPVLRCFRLPAVAHRQSRRRSTVLIMKRRIVDSCCVAPPGRVGLVSHMWRRSLAGFLCALLAACGSSSSSPSSPDPGNSPRLGDVASVRIFDATGVDLTEHLPFPGGTTLRLVIKLYAPD